MKQELASIISNDEVMPGVYLTWLESPLIASEAQPGQFVMVHCGKECLLRRPLSIHQLTNKTKLALLFTKVGKGTQWLAQCQAGDNIDILGPLGNGYVINPQSRNLLLLAGGMGIAPLYSLASSASKKGYSIKILLGARTATQLYLKTYQDQPIKAEFILVTEDGTGGKKGVLTDFLPDFTGWADQIFACGPMPMYRDMALKKQELKLERKPVQVSLEVRMGCGRGVCYGCTVKTKNGLKQVCKDGPVFELDDILWDELNY